MKQSTKKLLMYGAIAAGAYYLLKKGGLLGQDLTMELPGEIDVSQIRPYYPTAPTPSPYQPPYNNYGYPYGYQQPPYGYAQYPIGIQPQYDYYGYPYMPQMTPEQCAAGAGIWDPFSGQCQPRPGPIESAATAW